MPKLAAATSMAPGDREAGDRGESAEERRAVWTASRRSADCPVAAGRTRGTDLLESTRGRALPQVPSADVRRRGRAGAGGADAAERDRERPAAAGVPLRGAARHGQDLARAHPRQG